jgi:hypothetical protein
MSNAGAPSLSLLVPSGQVVFDQVIVAATDVLRGTSTPVRLPPVRVAFVDQPEVNVGVPLWLDVVKRGTSEPDL